MIGTSAFIAASSFSLSKERSIVLSRPVTLAELVLLLSVVPFIFDDEPDKLSVLIEMPLDGIRESDIFDENELSLYSFERK